MYCLLQINVVVNSGSTGRIAEEIGESVKGKGWRSVIAYGRNPRPSSSELMKIGNNWGVKWHAVQTRLFDKHGLGSKTATVELVDYIQRIKPDVIHLHNIHGYYINIEILFNYLASIDTPVVWTLHDCWPITGHCSYFSFCNCDRWKTLCFDCPQKEQYPTSIWKDRSRENYLLKKQLFSSVKNMTIVTVSNWLNEIVSESFLKHCYRKMIHNGIDTNVFVPISDVFFMRKRYNLDNKIVLLGVASIWDTRKGLVDFIKISKKLPENILILLVGLTDKQLKALPGNIIGIKRTENIQELAALYNVADLFINPTWEDNFPTTNLEALACGTPVLTYNTGGSVEAVSRDTGFIVEQGDIEGVLSYVDEVKQKGKDYYRKACRERALNLYDKKDRYADYLMLYETLMKKQ